MYTCGIDDSLKQVDTESRNYTGVDVKLGSQPRGMDFKDGVLVAATVKEVINFSGLNMFLLYFRAFGSAEEQYVCGVHIG